MGGGGWNLSLGLSSETQDNCLFSVCIKDCFVPQLFFSLPQLNGNDLSCSLIKLDVLIFVYHTHTHSRPHWSVERETNTETFGVSSVQGYRRGGRGRGRGGRRGNR